MISLAFKAIGSLKMIIIAGAIMAVAGLGYSILSDARASGYLRAEASRLSDIATSEQENTDRFKRSAEKHADLVDQYRDDIESAKQRESQLLAQIDEMEIEDEGYCPPGSLVHIPE